jgi:hypothetical protein
MYPNSVVRKVKEHFSAVAVAKKYATRKGIVHPEHDPIILDFCS